MMTSKHSSQSRSKAKITKYLIWLSVIIIVMLASYTSHYYSDWYVVKPDEPKWQITKFDSINEKIKEYFFSIDNIEKIIEWEIKNSYGGFDEFNIFFSIYDGKNRATVISGKGATLSDAWDDVSDLARNFVDYNAYNVEWLKVDIVNYKENINSTILQDRIINDSDNRDQCFRLGISLDDSFENAFLEGEINGNKLIDYKETKFLDLEEINRYFLTHGRQGIQSIPSRLILFSTRGYIYDGNDCYTLHHKQDSFFGRRFIDNLSDQYIDDVISDNLLILGEMIQADGKFIYGWYPTYDNQISGYNVLRHAGTLWTLLHYNEKAGNLVTKDTIDKAIGYLLSEIEYDSNEAAYLVERNIKEIKVGGNALAILALTEYMSTYKTDRFKEVCENLGNGILNMMDQENGVFIHVLYFDEEGKENFSVKDNFRIIYYDGEAAFALAKLYGLTEDQKWLDAATSAIENFIRNDYVQYKDHWVAYALNEITKYIMDQRYYKFALRNVSENLSTILSRPTISPTDLELLMATFQVYNRIYENEIEVGYLKHFDAKRFIESIFYRADYMLTGLFYPEFAMYLKKPDKVLGAFFIRQDGFRVRIDDIQHSIGGLGQVSDFYDELIYFHEHFKLKL